MTTKVKLEGIYAQAGFMKEQLLQIAKEHHTTAMANPRATMDDFLLLSDMNMAWSLLNDICNILRPGPAATGAVIEGAFVNKACALEEGLNSGTDA